MTNEIKPSKKTIPPIKRRFLNAWSKSKNFLKNLYSYWGNARITILGIVIFAVFYQSISYVRMESPAVWRINLICLQVLLFLLLLFISLKENIEIIKRIYRNSEGFVIPLLGGTATLLTFQAVSLFRSASTPEEKTLVINAWFVFITIEIFVGIILYQIKKSNLREDVIIAVKQVLIRHYAPYIATYTSVKKSEIAEKKNFYTKVYVNDLLAEESLLILLARKKLNTFLNDNEFENINKKIINGVASYIEKNNTVIVGSVKDAEIIQDDISINYIEGYNLLYVVKEGNPDSPKNSNLIKVDTEERKPPFVIFEDLSSNEVKNTFYDVNTEHIKYAEYINDRVKLTITSPNSPPKKIIVSLQEWLANRNDLR